MKQKQSDRWFNLAIVISLVLSFAGLRMCVHKVGQGTKVTAATVNAAAVDTIVVEKPRKEKKKKKGKTQKSSSGPVERSFLDEPISEPD